MPRPRCAGVASWPGEGAGEDMADVMRVAEFLSRCGDARNSNPLLCSRRMNRALVDGLLVPVEPY